MTSAARAGSRPRAAASASVAPVDCGHDAPVGASPGMRAHEFSPPAGHAARIAAWIPQKWRDSLRRRGRKDGIVVSALKAASFQAKTERIKYSFSSYYIYRILKNFKEKITLNFALNINHTLIMTYYIPSETVLIFTIR